MGFHLRRFSPGWGSGEHSIHKQFQKNKMPDDMISQGGVTGGAESRGFWSLGTSWKKKVMWQQGA